MITENTPLVQITEESVIVSINVLPDGQIEVARADRVWKPIGGGKATKLAETIHRHIVTAETDLENEDARVRAIAETVRALA